ncbi:MAG TPA: Ig-like domain-containing protein [Gemmatimonadaceae bacterium]|nr:Ig-like domain-containing protein [Gemmatimonadaceae bacterium]
MLRVVSALALCMGTLAACESATAPSRCAGVAEVGELHLLVEPAYGFYETGTIFVGDTLPLVASVRPEVGASVDIWGGGGCKLHYGDALPADIEWSSSDVRVATVTSTGLVRGVAGGTATITARDASRGMSKGVEIDVWVRGTGGP